ncbi:MAG: phosphoribulokinase [Anaerolineae bacterium]|nr:phosphoribulokinase [Thermoflexales bacterium]MDW8406615.1 phosphoribulokinase [Anaerolineae bacterium]
MTRRPIILGIVGDSAAGKSTLTNGLVKLLGEERVTHVCVDDYHKYDRIERRALNITPLHPDCNYLDIFELHLERLHYGQPILKPVYCHETGTLGRPEYVKPKEFVIVEGLLGFHTATMRQFYDVKVYLDPPEDLRRQWKIKRDTTKRGYTVEQVLADLERREPDAAAFIRPQRNHADIVVRFYPDQGGYVDGAHLNARLTLRPTVPHPDFSYLIQSGSENGSGVRLSLERDANRPVDVLEIDGNVSADQAEKLEAAIWAHLPGLRPLRPGEFGAFQESTETRHSNPLALTQLLLVYHLLRQYSNLTNLPMASPVAALSRLRAGSASTEQQE